MLTSLTNGLSTMLLAVGAVFAALVVLVGLIKCAEKILPMIVSNNIGANVKAAKAAKSAKAPIVVQTTNVNNDELVAVITAAVAMMLEEESKQTGAKNSGFVVRSIRRVNNAPAWNRAGREEQVYSRL